MSLFEVLYRGLNPMVLSIMGSVLGGILVVVFTVIFFKLRRLVRKWWFKRIFGQDADKDGEYFVIYAKLTLPPVFNEKREPITHPYIKPPRRTGSEGSSFSVENPVSSCELRAAKYICGAFGAFARAQPILASDMDMESSESSLNRSLVSLGGAGWNWKTDDVLNNLSNRFLKIEGDTFLSVENGKQVLTLEKGFDYGLILRVRPEEFHKKVWIVCAGIGEWGTSGAAWYLSNKWGKIVRANWCWSNPFGFGKGTDFATIVRVRPGQDESASSVVHFKSEEAVQQAANLKGEDS